MKIQAEAALGPARPPIVVDRDFVRLRHTSIAIAKINSVAIREVLADPAMFLGAIAAGVISAICFFLALAFGWVCIAFGVVAAAASWQMSQLSKKNNYRLMLTTDAGQVTAFESHTRRGVDELRQQIEQAIASR